MSRTSLTQKLLLVLWEAFVLFTAIPAACAAFVGLLVWEKIEPLLYEYMELQCVHTLAALRSPSVALDVKLDLLTKLKTHIKHYHVAEPAVNPAFEVIRYAISHPQLLDAGFSILSHLTKRLELQEQLPLVAAQGKKTYPIILERLGDAKDRVRLRAIQALTELWKASHTDVEQLVRDSALAGKSPRAKEASMQWIIKVRLPTLSQCWLPTNIKQMNMEFSLQFKSFVAKLVECLQDADPGVRDTAKSTIVELFLFVQIHSP
jgi:CLIP-associating protein 1/2